MNDTDPQIVGLDIGHGESAIALTRLRAMEPEVIKIDGASSIITAVGIDEKGQIVVGKRAKMLSRSLVLPYARFKGPDLRDGSDARDATELFVKGLLREVSRALIDSDNTLFFVGCPSGWDKEVQATYRQVLQIAGLRMVQIVPESRAAFLHARDKVLTPAELSRRVMIIDVGSSTTDFTFCKDMNSELLDFGHTDIGDIGSGIFDELILEIALSRHKDRDAVKRYLAEYPGERMRVDLKCRELKEDYFNGGPGTDYVSLDKGKMELEICVDDDVLYLIKTRKVEQLGGMSWVDAFRRRLILAKDKDPEFIILTGGASQMAFLKSLVTETFPAAKVVRGAEPDLCVAKGLAAFGRLSVISSRFVDDVDQLVMQKPLRRIVEEAIPQLYDSLAAAMAAAVVKILEPEMRRWRDGKTKTFREMEARVEKRLKEFGEDKGAKGLVARVVREWFNSIRPRLHELTDPVCVRHSLPAEALDLPPDTHKIELKPPGGNVEDPMEGVADVSTILGAIISTVVAMVLGGAGISVLGLPLIGQIAVGVGLFLGFLLGKEQITEWMKDQEIPVFSRPVILWDSKIKSSMENALSKVSAEIKQNLGKADETKLVDRIARQIGEFLRQKGDDAVLRFS